MHRRSTCLLPAALLLLGLPFSVAASPAEVHESFASVPSGALPEGWRVASGAFRVEEKALVAVPQAGEAALELPWEPRDEFFFAASLAQTETLPAGDAAAAEASFELRFARSEKSDQSDVRAHAVRVRFLPDGRASVEHVVHGGGDRAIILASERTGRSPAGARHAIEVRGAGGRVRVFWDGDRLLDSWFLRDAARAPVALAVSGSRVVLDDLEWRPLAEDEIAELRIAFGPVRDVAVIAHRGASAAAPENTLAAFRLAIERGAPAVEFDVWETQDHELVVLHDESLIRTTDFRSVLARAGKGPTVGSLPLEDIRRLDAGSWKSPEFRGERIPTFRETLELLRGRATPIVEIKPDGIGEAVAKEILALDMVAEVFVQSFSPRAVEDVRRVLPEVATGLLTGERVDADPIVRARAHLAAARRVGANAVVCHYELAEPEYVRELDRHAVTVWVYTVDEPALWDGLIRTGVDGIITDVPGRLLDFLEELEVRPLRAGTAPAGSR